MRESADFRYKVNLYEYCERYLFAQRNEHYGNLLIHPAPLNSIYALLFLGIPFKNLTKYASIGILYFFYWLENLILLCMFLIFEIAISPFVFIKTFLNYYLTIQSTSRQLVYHLVWALIGIPFIFFLIIKDCAYFLKVLSMNFT